MPTETQICWYTGPRTWTSVVTRRRGSSQAHTAFRNRRSGTGAFGLHRVRPGNDHHRDHPRPGRGGVGGVGVEQGQHLDPSEVDGRGPPGDVGEVLGGDQAVAVAEPAGDVRLAVAHRLGVAGPPGGDRVGDAETRRAGAALLVMAPMATWPWQAAAVAVGGPDGRAEGEAGAEQAAAAGDEPRGRVEHVGGGVGRGRVDVVDLLPGRATPSGPCTSSRKPVASMITGVLATDEGLERRAGAGAHDLLGDRHRLDHAGGVDPDPGERPGRLVAGRRRRPARPSSAVAVAPAEAPAGPAAAARGGRRRCPVPVAVRRHCRPVRAADRAWSPWSRAAGGSAGGSRSPGWRSPWRRRAGAGSRRCPPPRGRSSTAAVCS